MAGKKKIIGFWTVQYNDNYFPFGADPEYWYVCSNCASKQDKKTRFCPDCGTKMEDQE